MAKDPAALPAGKDHYLSLDGLRGVASLMVVLFHLCEAFKPEHPLTQPITTAASPWISSSCCRAS